MSHRFHFFCAGGVEQVSLRNGADLRALRELDQKLWVALAMPVQGLDIDRDTLALLDPQGEGRIRVPEILGAIEWADQTFTQLDKLLVSADEVALSQIKDPKTLAAAKRMLSLLGKEGEAKIGFADVEAISASFARTVLNGDGIVTVESTDDVELKQLVEDAIATTGPVTDRSGKPGVDLAHATELFAAVDQRAAWLARGRDPTLTPLGEGTERAAAALAAVREKIEDFFVRCRLAAFDPRAAAVLAGTETELGAIAQRSLSASDDELARLPLAKIDPAGELPLAPAQINPAWSARMAAFAEAAVAPTLGARDVLRAADLELLVARLAGYTAWRADRPVTKADGLAPDRIEQLAAPGPRAALTKLIEADQALAGEYDQIASVSKAVRMQRDFGRIARNFVNFSDFYSQRDGAFQAGTLYLDARALRLCVPVDDAARHGALAAGCDMCLVYCDLKREGKTRQIVAALTNGDSDNVSVGRNGLFYDRDGNDWDATITKIISNPISIREAFWSPYKKLIKVVEENIQKRAAAADAKSTAHMQAAGQSIAHADQTAPAPAPAPVPAPPKKIDLGTVAALGVAIGGIGTLVGVLMTGLFGLGLWLPLGILGVILMISGPSMLIAWLKLRRRNLGPLLDANGWAINSNARINVAFGAALTELAKLPPRAERSGHDPFADKRRPWKLYATLAILLIAACAWYFGKLDKYLPQAARSTTLLGKNAPAYVAPAGTSAAPS